MLAELQLSTDTQAYILGNSLRYCNPFEKHSNMLQKLLSICIPMNLYQGNNSEGKSYRHKDVHSRVICSKVNYVNINVK